MNRNSDKTNYKAEYEAYDAIEDSYGNMYHDEALELLGDGGTDVESLEEYYGECTFYDLLAQLPFILGEYYANPTQANSDAIRDFLIKQAHYSKADADRLMAKYPATRADEAPETPERGDMAFAYDLNTGDVMIIGKGKDANDLRAFIERCDGEFGSFRKQPVYMQDMQAKQAAKPQSDGVPATPKQVQVLKDRGLWRPGITKKEAYDLISKLMKGII
jgi:hypothetical protein